MRHERSPPKDSSYLGVVWDLKQRIQREEGYLCQTWDFFSSAYERNTAHVYFGDVGVVGFIVTRNDGYILFLGVHPELRGEGIGRSLIEEVAMEHDKMSCHARVSNDNAFEFYEYLGFEVERRVESYYQNGEAALYLVRDETESLRSRLADAITRDD